VVDDGHSDVPSHVALSRAVPSLAVLAVVLAVPFPGALAVPFPGALAVLFLGAPALFP